MRSRGAQSEPLAVVSNSQCQTAQSSSFPRRVVAPGFVLDVRVRPRTRGGRSADRRTCSNVARVRRDLIRTRRGAARPMTRDARLSALHRGDFRSGAALPSPALPPDPCSELLAARSSCLAGGVPASRGHGYEPQPRDATPRSVFRIVSGDAPHERGCKSCSINSLRSQVKIHDVGVIMCSRRRCQAAMRIRSRIARIA